MKALNQLTTSLISLTLSLTAAHATTVSFSEAEGYVNGSLSSQNPSSGYTWSYQGSGITVDKDNGGSVTIPGGFSGSPAIYSAPFSISVGTVFSVSMDFQFIGLDVSATPSSSLSVLNFSLGSGSTWNTEIKLTLGMPTWGTVGNYQAQQYTGTGTPATSVDPALMGLTSTGGSESSHLRLTLSGTIGANSDGTTPYSAVLTNLDNSSTVFSIDGYRDLSAYTTLYLNFSGPSAGSSMTITQLEYSSVVPEPATWAMIVGGMGMLVLSRRIRRS